MFNNAGISNSEHPKELPSAIDRQEFLGIMNVNVAGPIKVEQIKNIFFCNSISPTYRQILDWYTVLMSQVATNFVP